MTYHLFQRSDVRPRGLPRRAYPGPRGPRYVLEFHVCAGCARLRRRCAVCGYAPVQDAVTTCSLLADIHDLFAPPDPLSDQRVFPGQMFLMDGYVCVCDDCGRRFIQGHAEPSGWAGVPAIRPIRDDRFEILAYGYTDDRRAADAFVRVWDAIPRSQRGRILAHLDCDGRPHVDGHPPVAAGRLRIETLPGWPNWWKDTLGVNCERGHVIRLWSGAVDRMERPALSALLAHEIAHTLQLASGAPMISIDSKAEKWREEDADRIATRWGFDIASFRDRPCPV